MNIWEFDLFYPSPLSRLLHKYLTRPNTSNFALLGRVLRDWICVRRTCAPSFIAKKGKRLCFQAHLPHNLPFSVGSDSFPQFRVQTKKLRFLCCQPYDTNWYCDFVNRSLLLLGKWMQNTFNYPCLAYDIKNITIGWFGHTAHFVTSYFNQLPAINIRLLQLSNNLQQWS